MELTLEQKHGISWRYRVVSVSYAETDIETLKNRRGQCSKCRKEIKKLTAYVKERRNAEKI